MKYTLLAFMLAVTPLVHVFIYDATTCVLEDHIVAQKIKILPKEHAIRLFSQDENGWTSDEILVQERQEFHINDGKKIKILRFDGETLIERKVGSCK